MEHNSIQLIGRQIALYIIVSIFAIFIGSQITEGVLLVPYWQSLPAANFYNYYAQFGPGIGLFYTVLTIIAALIPIVFSIYCKLINSTALKNALISSFFALLFILTFYVYFKGTNELFYQFAFNDEELKRELIIWSYWHWSRIVIECISLIFLILAIVKMQVLRDVSKI